jgi:hypothetical protein
MPAAKRGNRALRKIRARAPRVLAAGTGRRPPGGGRPHIGIPITPEKVWNILKEKGAAE